LDTFILIDSIFLRNTNMQMYPSQTNAYYEFNAVNMQGASLQ